MGVFHLRVFLLLFALAVLFCAQKSSSIPEPLSPLLREGSTRGFVVDEKGAIIADEPLRKPSFSSQFKLPKLEWIVGETSSGDLYYRGGITVGRPTAIQSAGSSLGELPPLEFQSFDECTHREEASDLNRQGVELFQAGDAALAEKFFLKVFSLLIEK